MASEFFYICPNDYHVQSDSDDSVEVFAPIYEDFKFPQEVSIPDIYSVGDLVTDFVMFGERFYYKVDKEQVKNYLVKVEYVEAEIVDESALIRYHFFNGIIFQPEREYIIDEFYSRTEIESILKMAKIAASHLYYLDCDIQSSWLKFDCERWG